jgi:hypothetical protein
MWAATEPRGCSDGCSDGLIVLSVVAAFHVYAGPYDTQTLR